MSKSDNENEIHLSFYVPAETRRALMVLAAIEGMKLTPYIRRLLVQHAREQSLRLPNVAVSNPPVEASPTMANGSTREVPAPAPAAPAAPALAPAAPKVSSPATPKDIAEADVTDMNFDEIGDLLKSLP